MTPIRARVELPQQLEPRLEHSDVAAYSDPDFSEMQSAVETAVHELFLDGEWAEDFNAFVSKAVLLAMYGERDYARIMERLHG